MYLSRLILNPALRTTRELLLNPYRLHQAVFRAFPDATDDGPGRVLYRMDTEKAGRINLLVQSKREPDWNKADLLLSCVLDNPEYKAVSLDFKEGQVLHFRLRANPTVKKADELKKNGYRLGLLREEDQLNWMQNKARQGGFSLVVCRAIPEGISVDERGKEGGKLRHYAVLFEGTLKVNDPDLFKETVEGGIGTAKGFGFGLLSLAAAGG